jgi:hypothetical protein
LAICWRALTGGCRNTRGGRGRLADAARQSRWESRDNQDENAPLPG